MVSHNKTYRPVKMPKNDRTIEFSVVIPLYNKRNHIIAALQSIQRQTYSASEIIVVDDGSTDGGADLIAKTFGDSVSIIWQKNSGVSSARNTGVNSARSEYVAFLDADDFWAPHFLEELAALYEKQRGAGLLASAYQYFEADNCYANPKIRGIDKNLSNGKLHNYFAIAASGDLPFNASSVAIKRDLLLRLGGFPVDEGMGEDQCLWSRVALHSTIAYSRRALSFYNRSADNRACQAIPPANECPFSRRLITYVNNVSTSRAMKKQVIAYTAAHLIQLADRNIAVSNYSAARKLLADPRCSIKPLKKSRSLCRLYTAKVTELLTLLPCSWKRDELIKFK